MNISPVSFGQVTVVTAKPKKMNKLNKRLAQDDYVGRVIVRDVTSSFRNTMPSGEFSRAAQKGESVSLYITGEDIEKVQKQEPGWTSIQDILLNIGRNFNADQMFMSDIVNSIMKM